MQVTINPEMITLARELRGYTQTRLAELSGISQYTISRYEGGGKEVSPEDLEKLVQTLEFPAKFFYREGKRRGIEGAETFHRKQASAQQGDLKRIDALVDFFRLNAQILLSQIEAEAPYKIPQYDTAEYTPGEIAGLVRAAWNLPSGPIKNMVATLEAASCLIHTCNFGAAKIDEVMQWTFEPNIPILVLNQDVPGDRMRFTLAHALGHLVMHHNESPRSEMEDEANEFAAAFLMPAEDIASELRPVNLNHLMDIKPYWKVSVAAMVMRAYDLEIIDDRRKKSLFQMMSRKGQRKEEAYPIAREAPTLIEELINFYQVDMRYTNTEMGGMLGISEKDFVELYLPRRSRFKIVRAEDYRQDRKAQ